ncbi:MAG: PQQ-dependent sugar dehydrogenase [Candidatus Bathyarchaeia archaeon]
MKQKSVFILILTNTTSFLFLIIPYASAQTQTGDPVQTAFPNLTFNQPTSIVNDGFTNRLFVTEQTGRIMVFNNSQNVSSSTVFLDLTDRVVSGGEQGLLGLTFHPNFEQNGYFYVNYVASNPLRTVIARFTQPEGSSVADKNSEQIILTVNQPFSNHNGGQLAFGPDGYLYIGLGDGGSPGDSMGNGQSLSTLLGKILRINVDSSTAGRNYAIPQDNPYVGNSLGYREEIYAYGFRNPWRFSFDSANGQLWVGDVGQNSIEEIDLVSIGKNYGWNIMEGTLCYNPASGCNQTGLELPIWNYTHDLGNAIVGGYVYHGFAIPSLTGSYVYGDFGSGRIWALTYNGDSVSNVLLADTDLNIASFGLDLQGELYFGAFDGKIYQLNPEVIPEMPVPSMLCILFVASTVALMVFRKSLKRESIKPLKTRFAE